MASNPDERFVRRPVCPGCGHPHARTLISGPYDEAFLSEYYRPMPKGALRGGLYEVAECLACSLAFQRYVPNAELLTEIYNHWLNQAAHDDPHAAEALAQPWQSRDGQEIAAARHVLGRSLKVLDYGMGWALWARVAVAMGCDAFGFDLSADRMRAAAAYGVKTTDAEGFDFINAEQVIEHLVDPRETVQRLAVKLRPGGILKIAVPQAPDLERRLKRGEHVSAIHPLEHLNCFTPRALDVLAASAGLEPTRVPLAAYAAWIPKGLSPIAPKKLTKGLARPLYHRFSRTNLYRWFSRPRSR